LYRCLWNCIRFSNISFFFFLKSFIPRKNKKLEFNLVICGNIHLYYYFEINKLINIFGSTSSLYYVEKTLEKISSLRMAASFEPHGAIRKEVVNKKLKK